MWEEHITFRKVGVWQSCDLDKCLDIKTQKCTIGQGGVRNAEPDRRFSEKQLEAVDNVSM